MVVVRNSEACIDASLMVYPGASGSNGLVEVIPPMGGTNYVTEIQTAVSKIAVPRVGDILGVFVDPANPSALALAA